MAAQYCSPLVAVDTGGVFNHSSTGLIVAGVLNVSKLSKYLLRDDCGCVWVRSIVCVSFDSLVSTTNCFVVCDFV